MLTDIRLQNFRSYSDESFELSGGVNIVVGPNASGKTNLLEAILVLNSGRSYRVHDQDLIKHKRSWARLDAHTISGSRSFKIEAIDSKIRKTFIIDDKPLTKLKLEQALPVVLFEPNTLWLFNGEPSLRRDFLDNLLEQLENGFSELRARYQRTLKQRNALLKKETPGAKDQLFAWNVRLSELGGQIASARLRLINLLAKDISRLYSLLAGNRTRLSIEYKTSLNPVDYSSQMLKKLESSSELDFLRGFTAHGPHRDDLLITINKQPINLTASRGESRTLVLVLKIIELRLLEESRGLKPLLLLDDVFSELDGQRRQAVTEFFKDYQTFITTTDADIVVKNFSRGANVIPLQKLK